jgi:hypothetical protein
LFKTILLLLVSITVAIAVNSCSKDPTSSNSKLNLLGQDIISTAVFDSDPANINQRTSTYDFILKSGFATQIILGKSSYGESDALMRFNLTLSDSLLNNLKSNNLTVKSAWVTMDSTYSLGSQTAAFDFYAYNITNYNYGQPWMLNFDRDSLSLLTFDNTNQNINTSPPVVDSASMTFNINPGMVMSWLKAQYQINNITDKNLGMILKPKSGTNRFFGFDAITSQPTLHVVLQTPSSGLDTLSYTTSYCLHVFTGAQNIVTRSDEFYLEGSQSLRGTLFFDLSSLPKYSLFNKATLTLTVDTINTFDGSPSSNAIRVQVFADSSAVRKLADSVTASTLARSGNQFSGDIDWIIQKWNDGKIANRGLLLSLSDELTSAARIAIYNSTVQNKDLRPRLKLYYIQKK